MRASGLRVLKPLGLKGHLAIASRDTSWHPVLPVDARYASHAGQLGLTGTISSCPYIAPLFWHEMWNIPQGMDFPLHRSPCNDVFFCWEDPYFRNAQLKSRGSSSLGEQNRHVGGVGRCYSLPCLAAGLSVTGLSALRFKVHTGFRVCFKLKVSYTVPDAASATSFRNSCLLTLCAKINGKACSLQSSGSKLKVSRVCELKAWVCNSFERRTLSFYRQ